MLGFSWECLLVKELWNILSPKKKCKWVNQILHVLLILAYKRILVVLIVFVVQSLSRVQLFVTPWTAAHQASLSFTISQSLLKLASIGSVMPSNCLILCHTLLLLPLIFSSTGSFPVSWLCTRWLKYWSFSFNNNPSNKYLGLTSFRIDWLDLLAIQVTLKSLFQHNLKASIPHGSAFFMVQLSHLCDYWKDHSFD